MLAVLNKDASQELVVPVGKATVIEVLSAPALDSREAHLSKAAQPGAEQVKLAHGLLRVPAHTGVLLRPS